MTVEFRRATHADNEAILEFMVQHAMSAGLQLRFDRSPDFFALPNAHSPDNETWLMCDAGQIGGLATLVFRPGYVHGNVEPVIYLSDLRIAPNRQTAGQWRERFASLMKELASETGSRYGYCAIIRANRLARNSIVGRQSPGFRHLCGYSTLSLLARKPFRPRNETPVTRATAADTDELVELLDGVSRSRLFGAVFDRKEFARRLASWPGLSLDNFLVTRDAAGKLNGCLALWDYAALKRVIVDALPAGANALRKLLNALAPLHGRARIAAPPAAIVPDIAISHLAIRDADAGVFAALLDAATRESFAERQAATLSLCLYDNDPLRPAVADYWHYDVPMDLYSLCIDLAAPQLAVRNGGLPGFEFYLV